jgi:hypothetical protein
MLQWNPATASGEDLDWAEHTAGLREQLARAQDRFKNKVDKNHTERSFVAGEQVLLKLQPYAQTTVANRPCKKLAYKYFGPFAVEQKIDSLA